MAWNLIPQSWLLLIFVFVFQFCVLPISHSQSNPQNIQTSYPFEPPSPSPSPSPSSPSPSPSPSSPSPSPSPSSPSPSAPSNAPTKRPESPPVVIPAPAPVVRASRSSSSSSKIVKAVAGTAASTLAVSALIFFFVKYLRRKRRKDIGSTGNQLPGDRRTAPQANVLERIDGNVRGLILDEDGLDVVYWRELEGKNTKVLKREVLDSAKKMEQHQEIEEDGNDEAISVKKSKSIQEIHLLRGKSSTSHLDILPEENEINEITTTIPPPAPPPTSPPSSPLPPPPPPSAPLPPPVPPLPLPTTTLSAIPKSESPTTSLLVTPKSKSPAPPSPPPTQWRKSPAPSSPPPVSVRTRPAPPTPPPPKAGIVKSSSKPPPTTYEKPKTTGKSRKPSGGVSENSNGQVKLKPLHWDKVNTNADHSMVWDNIDRGSFRVDGDLMEALFGYVAAHRRSPVKSRNSTSSSDESSDPQSKTFLLDPRKSQNIAIILKSLTSTREEILDALSEGHGLNVDTIEKLSRITPTEEEQSQIFEYNGDPTNLAAGESFLYQILKAVPSAFKRLNAMLFKLNYDSEMQQIRESLQILDLGCKELRNRGIFMKLLEAVLKAGNRMNAGTSRGNAEGFSLTSLRKLSDVKSTDGKTTFLHFLVQEVVRSEGKRCVLNRNLSLSRSGSRSSNSSAGYESSSSKEQTEREYITLGLPIVGGLSSELSNVKKASAMDYNTLVGSISSLSTRIAETRELVSRIANDRERKFVKEMKHFLENAEEELKLVREEQTRVMQLVKRTTQYYQGGVSKYTAENPLQLFFIVKDFLAMVDQACIEIARNLQKRKMGRAGAV